MENDAFLAAEQAGFGFSGPELLLGLMGAVIVRLIPLLILISAAIKLRRYPDLRALHLVLIAAVFLLTAVGAIDTFAPSVVPGGLRASGGWSFLWIFAVSWLAVTWVRSAIKTQLRPRGIDIATLAGVGFLGLVLAASMAGLV